MEIAKEFPFKMNVPDFVRSSHSRPSAWVRFGKIEIKDQNLSPLHAKELADWIQLVLKALPKDS